MLNNSITVFMVLESPLQSCLYWNTSILHGVIRLWDNETRESDEKKNLNVNARVFNLNGAKKSRTQSTSVRQAIFNTKWYLYYDAISQNGHWSGVNERTNEKKYEKAKEKQEH